jgi:cyclic pyranopterin phosphate synthase
VVNLARFLKERRLVARFIEFMDVGTLNAWRLEDVVPASEIVAQIDRVLPLEPLKRAEPSDTAERYRYRDDGVEIGVIASVTQPFCGDCTRGRISAAGALYTCLFASDGLDLKTPLREGWSDDEIGALIADRWRARDDRYSEQRAVELAKTGTAPALARVEMFRIGG